MEINVGTLDRVGRACFAMAALGFALKKQGRAGVFLAFGAGDVMGSAISGFCPVYKLLNMSTVGKPI